MNLIRSPRVAQVAFAFFLLFTLIGFTTTETAARGRHSRGRASRRVARGGRLSRHERRMLARSGRRGRRLSKREMRAERARLAREQSAYIEKLQKRGGRKLSKRELA